MKNSVVRQVVIGVYSNLLAALSLSILYFVGQPYWKIGWIVIVSLVTVISLESFHQFILKKQFNYDFIKHLGFYLVPTSLFFWAFDQYSQRMNAENQILKERLAAEDRYKNLEREIEKLRSIIAASPDANIICNIIDPTQQKKSLHELLKIMNESDERLARLMANIRYWATAILNSVGTNGNYTLFKQVMAQFSRKDPQNYHETYKQLIWFLSDIYDLSDAGKFSEKIQKDFLDVLIDSFYHADDQTENSHFDRLKHILDGIMNSKKEDGALAMPILSKLLDLKCQSHQKVMQTFVDACKNRAIRFPNQFGIEFLSVLNRMEHSIFYLNFHSLQDALENLRNLLPNFQDLCQSVLNAKIFASLGNSSEKKRAFSRLVTDDGKFSLECVLSDGSICTCVAKSLSLRGLFSEKCSRSIGEKLKMKMVPIKGIGPAFQISGSIPKQHTNEHGIPVSGRGIFFENADELTAKGIYDYLIRH